MHSSLRLNCTFDLTMAGNFKLPRWRLRLSCREECINSLSWASSLDLELSHRKAGAPLSLLPFKNSIFSTVTSPMAIGNMFMTCQVKHNKDRRVLKNFVCHLLSSSKNENWCHLGDVIRHSCYCLLLMVDATAGGGLKQLAKRNLHSEYKNCSEPWTDIDSILYTILIWLSGGK